MSSPNECQGKAYYTPSAANPLYCYRCHVMMPNQQENRAQVAHQLTVKYEGSLTSNLPTGDMGD